MECDEHSKEKEEQNVQASASFVELEELVETEGKVRPGACPEQLCPASSPGRQCQRCPCVVAGSPRVALKWQKGYSGYQDKLKDSTEGGFWTI